LNPTPRPIAATATQLTQRPLTLNGKPTVAGAERRPPTRAVLEETLERHEASVGALDRQLPEPDYALKHVALRLSGQRRRSALGEPAQRMRAFAALDSHTQAGLELPCLIDIDDIDEFPAVHRVRPVQPGKELFKIVE
jgi:hypothetical protein